MQEEWARGVSQWVARREVERVNLYFRRKMGILKGHSTDEWKEGYGEWQDRALMSRVWKWLRRPGKGMSRSKAQRRMVASVRISVDRSTSRRRRILSPTQAAPKTKAREANQQKRPEASEDHLVMEDTDEEGILSTEPVAANYEGIYVFSKKTKEQYGPYSMMQLQKFVDQGYFTAHDLAIYQGLEKWVTLEHVPDIRFPVAEAYAEPNSEPEPVAEEILAPEDDAPALGTQLVEDAESEPRQSEMPAKRNLAGSLFRVVAMVCSFLILFLFLCDIMNQHLGWNIPLGLGMVGISTTDDVMESKNYQSQDVANTTNKSNDMAALTAELERTKKELALARSATPPAESFTTPRSNPTLVPPPDVETLGKAFTIPDLSLDMLWVPAGTFTMGSPTTEAGRGKDETQHQVTLTKGFYLGKYEVTQAQWEKVMGSNPSRLKGSNRPVEQVSWNDAVAFCKKLTEIEKKAGRLPKGMAYQLPTEAQSEYACRAGTGTIFSWGNSASSTQANFNGTEPYGGGAAGPNLQKTTDVGSYLANPWGFHDLHGNVHEWCADWYGTYQTGPVSDPVGPVGGSARVIRGGLFRAFGKQVRSAERHQINPAERSGNLGFRLSLRTVAVMTEPQVQEPEEASVAASVKAGKAFTIPDLSLDMLWVPAGTFTMGSPSTETGRHWSETEHKVTFTKGFYLGKYEVTQAQYETVMTGNPNSLNPVPSNWPNNPNRPVENVSWNDVQIFLTRLNDAEQAAGRLPIGWSYVLPTEAQWEYACRAGTTTAYSWGNTIASSNANYNWVGSWNTGNDFKQTRDVGQYMANPWGFFDMHGNVYEWTADWYQSAYPTGTVTDPPGAPSGSSRVQRGGAWGSRGTDLRSAKRTSSAPGFRNSDLGFRVGFQKQ